MMTSLDPEVDLGAHVAAEDAASLHEFLQAIGAKRWDAIMFADGSGSKVGKPGGYGVAIIDRRKAGVVNIAGAVTNSTSQESEVRAVFEGLSYLNRRKKGHKSGGYIVQLITDSAYVAESLRRINKAPEALFAGKQHHMLWLGIQFVSRRGILVRPTHIHRNQNPLMTLADKLSKGARLAVQGLDCEQMVQDAVSECETVFKL